MLRRRLNCDARFTAAVSLAAVLACVFAVATADEPRINPLRLAPTPATVVSDAKGFADERDKLCQEALKFAADEKWDRAIEAAKKALTIQQSHFGAEQPEAFGILESIAVWHDRAGDYRAATDDWSELAQLSGKVRGESHWTTVTARSFHDACRLAAKLTPPFQHRLADASRLRFQADQQLAAGKYAEARDLARPAFEIRRALLGSDNAVTAISAHTLGTALLALRDCQSARPILEACADQREQIYGLPNPATLVTLTCLSALYVRIDEPALARTTLEKLLSGNSKLYGPLHPVTVASLYQLGDFEFNQDHLSDAETMLALAKTEQTKIYHGQHLELAQTCKSLGLLYLKKHDFAEAKENLQQSYELYQALAGNDHPDTGRALVNLATLEKLRRRPNEAIGHLHQAIDIFTAALGEKSDDTIDAVHLLASTLPEIGDYAHAERLYRQVLQNYLDAYGENDPRTALVLFQMGTLYASWNDIGSAETCLQRALAIFRKTSGETHAETAGILSMLATVDARSGRFEKAEAESQAALEIVEKQLGPTNAQTVAASVALGHVYLLEEKLDDAEKLLSTILSKQPEATDDDRYHNAIIREKLAMIALEKRHYAEALSHCDAVITAYTQLLPELHPHRLEPLTIAAIANIALHRDEAAKKLIDQALKLARLQLDSTALAESERQQMALNLRHREILDLELSLPREQVSVREAYEQVLRWKGAVQARQIRLRRSLNAADVPMADELQATTTRLATLSLNVPEGAERKPWLAELENLKQRKETLEANLAARSGDFQTQIGTVALSPEQLQSLLPADTALVDVLEYVQFSGGHDAATPDETRYVAFVVRRDRPIERIDLCSAMAIDEAVDSCRANSLFETGPKATEQLEKLSALVWQPIAPAVAGCRIILYSPDNNLARFPLAALPGKKPGSYLIEDYTIGIVPVPQLLPEMLTDRAGNTPRDQQTADLLVVGNIDYDAAAGQNGNNHREQLTKDEAGGELLTFERLKSAPDEMRSLQTQFNRRFPAGTLRVLQQAEATEKEFRREAPQHRWLFIATHGFSSPPNVAAALATQDELVGLSPGHGGTHSGALCGLALAGANRPVQPDGDDGILTAYEVSTLDLRKVELAVLSGCETGLGETTLGEGPVSMQRAFQTAGARATVASLWGVPDDKSKDLMEQFLANLWNGKMSKLEALRAAQLSILHGESNLSAAGNGATSSNRLAPYYWAAFIFSGDWR
jgi:CHAT domain-containing protein